MSKRIIKPIKVSCPTKRYRQTELKFGPTKAGASVIQPDCSSSLLRGLSEVVGDGLHIHKVPYDGDCFLHAVIHQMSCKQQPVTETAETLRRSAVLWLRSNPAVVVGEDEETCGCCQSLQFSVLSQYIDCASAIVVTACRFLFLRTVIQLTQTPKDLVTNMHGRK
jgi:hypothetical protein